MEELKRQLEQARRIWKEGNYADAYALYETLLRDYQSDPLVLSHYGLARYAGTDDIECATKLLEQSLTFRPDFIMALLGLGELYAMRYGPKKSEEDAFPIFQRVIHLTSSNKRAKIIALVQTGLLLQSQEERINAFQQASNIDPTNVSAHQNLAMEFCLCGNFQRARDELKLAERLLREAKMPTHQIQKDLEKVERKEGCKPRYVVETVLGSWFDGQTDTW